mmetsp:Transcript_30826/g.27267  ORF Transcript_30826/g.27267 Transcript_30826/m.27267 type:complete len:163 (-) Transcript_30826:370-858(-)
MFLADGKVLIVNNDLYQEVMKKAIIIDLKDKGEPKTNSNAISEEEVKEAPVTSVKYDNSRSVTQGKKNKKANQSSSRANKEEAVPDPGEAKFKENIPLKKEILTMMDNKEFSDITLIVEGKEIYCHKAVLSSRSSYFKAMFSHDFKESEKSRVSLKDVSSYT